MQNSSTLFMTCVVALLTAMTLATSAPETLAQTHVSPYQAREVKPGFSPPGPRQVAPPDTQDVFIFYPKHNMYLDVANDKYIYRKNDRWLIYNQNPIDESLGPSYTIDSESNKPYQQNSEHLKRYPYESD